MTIGIKGGVYHVQDEGALLCLFVALATLRELERAA